MSIRNAELNAFESRYGIVFPGAVDFLPRHWDKDDKPGAIDLGKANIAFDAMMAFDAGTQAVPVTTSNAGIPAFLSTYVDPKLIEVLLTPTRAAEIYGETQKGDWKTETAMFSMVESTGETSVYGDYSENGRAGANVQWPQRQSMLYQTITEWGERELERMELARVDWAARMNIASALVLNRFQNRTYFGVAGLQNYGGLNDPSLSASLTPTTKTAGGTSWSVALPTEILADVQKMFIQLQTQTGSNLQLDETMTLSLHSTSETYLANTNSFGLTAAEMVKKVFPNIRIVNAVEYLSGTTYSAQLIVDSIDGQKTADAGFNVKMRAHPVIRGMSSFRQKKTQGTWGTVIYRPIGIVGMAGI
jgi:hypothetical protein